MLVHKGGQINNVQLITGVRIAEMSQLKIAVSCVQRMEVIVKMKKREKKSGGQGGCVQRMEVIVKREKKGGGQGRKKNLGGRVGSGEGGGSGQVRGGWGGGSGWM